MPTARRVLLVLDDNEADQKLIDRHLGGAYHIESAYSLRDALDMLLHLDPAAVVVDLGGVGAQWSEILRDLNQATEAPLIVHTGNQQALDGPFRSFIFQAGADAIQIKDSGSAAFEQLDSTVRDQIDRASHAQQGLPMRLGRIESYIRNVGEQQAHTAAQLETVSEQLEVVGDRMAQLLQISEMKERRLSRLEELVPIEPEPAPSPEPAPTPASRWTWPPTRQQIAGVLGGASVLGAIAHEIWIAFYGPAPDELPTPPPTEIVEQAPEE